MAEIKIEDIKPNSHKYKQEQAKLLNTDKEKRDTKAIVQAHKKKKGLSEKFAESFVKEDTDSVKDYVIFDVIVPAVKDIASDVITGAVDMLLYGETRGRGRSRRRGSTKVSYDSFYRNTSRSSSHRSNSRRDERRKKENYNDILYDSRDDADEVLDTLLELIETDGEATIADLYDLSGITADFADEGWGWTNLSSAKVRKDRSGGWYIDLPRPRGL